MGTFSFGNININSKKKSLGLEPVLNCLLLDESERPADYDFLPIVLVEEPYEEYALKGISRFLKSAGLTRFKLLCTINCKPTEEALKAEGKIKFYQNHRSNFREYIPTGAPILTSGAALYSLLMENDLYPQHVEQRIFGKSSFWFSEDLTPQNCHRIYPVDTFRSIFIQGFKVPVDSFRTKLAQLQIADIARNGGMARPRYPKLNKVFIESFDDFEEKFWKPNQYKNNEVLAYDLETTGLSFYKDKPGCITLSFDGITGYYIPWHIIENDHDNLEKLDFLLAHNKQLGANLKFDVKFLWKAGLKSARIDEDIITLGHTLDETRGNSLKTLAYFYSEFGGYERPLDQYKDKLGKKDVNYILDIPEEIMRDYAVMDAIVTRRVWGNMIKHIKELDEKYPNDMSSKGMMDYYYERRIPADNMYSKIEYTGVYVDKEKLDKLRVEMTEYLNSLRAELDEAFGVSNFDWGSAVKLGQLLKERGWEDWGITKTGVYATGDDQLKRWAKEHPEAKTIQQMRSIATLLQTFVGDEMSNSFIADFLGETDAQGEKGWSQCLVYHPEDDSWRMHPNFKSMRADSGRSICTSPNTQQFPTRGKFTKEIKSCIKTPDDEKFYMVTVDYSSLQMRLAQIDSGIDDHLHKTLLKPGADVHCATAYNVFAQNRYLDVEVITVTQDGKIKEFLGGELVMTQRGEILAKDLKEEDTIQNF